ncbi:hypothetical protein HAX54_020688 [Datura stramonium]|uniref:Uncharacterized protein n=1 Tax=Datura stramonium TaxID=4076 RepID=A0ABS8USR1_DATST|nr:hypothetical protein [Datura stramonium]
MGHALVDVELGELKFRVDGDEVIFNVHQPMKPPDEYADLRHACVTQALSSTLESLRHTCIRLAICRSPSAVAGPAQVCTRETQMKHKG